MRIVVAVLACLLASVAGAVVPTPTVEGPVTGGNGSPAIASTLFDLSKVGYQQAEYFVSGTASAFTSASALTSDGMWSVTPGDTAAYKTRVLVYRPTDPKKFKGTVMVEWLNVSAGGDAAPDWLAGHVEMIREGIAWVGVSAQKVGVETGINAIKKADPVRYASLVHPGDSFAYDIYSQVGQAIRQPGTPGLLGDLKVKRVIALGESQSAFRMTTYVNAIHPLALIYDGFLIHSRGKSAAALSEAPQPTIAAPSPTFTRTDLHAPVLIFATETDITVLGYGTDVQPDTKKIRLWEVPGTAHVDTYTIGSGFTDIGTSSAIGGIILTFGLGCDEHVNSGPQHWVLDAALAALNRWVRHGAPRVAPRFQVSLGPPITLARDAHGNALGGIRTPQLDAPIATFSGTGNTGGGFCFLFGTTVPFDQATLASLYPTHEAFVSAYNKSLKNAVHRRFIVPADAKLLKAWAAASDIGG